LAQAHFAPLTKDARDEKLCAAMTVIRRGTTDAGSACEAVASPKEGSGIPTSPSAGYSLNKYKAGPVSFDQVVKKLNTKEDRFYAHKILGILSLASFLYRYFYVLPKTGTLGFDELDVLNVGTMVVHTVLSCSAIIFRVPLKRIFRQPTMIWHEYRLHAIGFTWRCTLVFVLAALTQDKVTLLVPEGWPPAISVDLPGSSSGVMAAFAHAWATRKTVIQEQFVRFCVAISMHVVADLITLKYGESGTTTVRGVEAKPLKNALLRRLTLLYGSYQFLALGSHLVPSARGMDMGYNTLIAIQSSAFCMTLNRKGLIHYTTHSVVYGICLLLSGAYILLAMRSWTFFVAVLMAGFVRTQLRVNKYLIWSTFAAAFALGGGLGASVGTLGFLLSALWAGLWKRHGIFEVVASQDSPAAKQEKGEEAVAYGKMVEETVDKLQ